MSAAPNHRWIWPRASSMSTDESLCFKTSGVDRGDVHWSSQEHFTHADEWATRMHARVASALDARVRHPTKPNASHQPDARIVIATGGADAEGGPAARETIERADRFCVMTDAQRAHDTGATACTEAEFVADETEARLLASVRADGHSFGVSKALLTLVLEQGRDAVLTALPDAVVDVLHLTCPDLIESVATPPS